MIAAPVVIQDELLTEQEAAARVGGRRADVTAWLRGLGIARQHPTNPGRRMYRWADILSALPTEQRPANSAPVPEVDTQAAHRRRVRL